jgi:hypothetical protein
MLLPPLFFLKFINFFIYNTEQINIGNVGEIYKIRIGHDDSGDAPGWLCDEVLSFNISSAFVYIFLYL